MKNDNRSVDNYALIEMIETKPFYPVPVSFLQIVRDSSLTFVQKFLLIELLFDYLKSRNYQQKINQLKISISELAKRYNRSNESIRRILRALESAYFIQKIYKTIKDSAGNMKTIIIAIEFTFPNAIAEDAIRNTENRKTTPAKTDGANAHNKNVVCPQQEKPKNPQSQDNKKVNLTLDQDLISNILDLTLTITKENKYTHTLNRSNVIYILRRFDKLKYYIGKKTILQFFTQMLYDINKENWPTNNKEHRLNKILKMIENNDYRAYISRP